MPYCNHVEAPRQCSCVSAGGWEGMQPLRLSGARKIQAGFTTLEEVTKVGPSSDVKNGSLNVTSI